MAMGNGPLRSTRRAYKHHSRLLQRRHRSDHPFSVFFPSSFPHLACASHAPLTRAVRSPSGTPLTLRDNINNHVARRGTTDWRRSAKFGDRSSFYFLEMSYLPSIQSPIESNFYRPILYCTRMVHSDVVSCGAVGPTERPWRTMALPCGSASPSAPTSGAASTWRHPNRTPLWPLGSR